MFPKIGDFPPKSSISIAFSIIDHPLWGTPIFGNIHLYLCVFTMVFSEWEKFGLQFHQQKTAGCLAVEISSLFIGLYTLPPITMACDSVNSVCISISSYLSICFAMFHWTMIVGERVIPNDWDGQNSSTISAVDKKPGTIWDGPISEKVVLWESWWKGSKRKASLKDVKNPQGRNMSCVFFQPFLWFPICQ